MKFIQLFLVILLLPFTGCSTISYSVDVNGLVSDEYVSQKNNFNTYIILPDITKNKTNDLFFQETSKCVSSILLENNIKITNNKSEANCIILIDYGISSPNKQTETTTLPVFGQTGTVSSNTYGAISNGGNFSSTTTNNNTYGVVGYDEIHRTYITYKRWLTLTAYSIDLNDKKVGNVIWQTLITSEGSSDDYRSILPIMTEILKVNLIKDTKGKKHYNVIEKKDGLKIGLE